MQAIADGLKNLGYNPFNLPVGLKLNEVDKTISQCIRCDTCDGFPCLVDGKADAQVNCINPTRDRHNVTLMTGAKVMRLHTSSSGKEVTQVETEITGRTSKVFRRSGSSRLWCD